MFHSDKLLKNFKSQCEKAAKSKNGIFSIDGDTKIMEYTQKAAYRAVGSIILALDHIYCSSTKIAIAQGVDESISDTKLSTSPVKAAIFSRDALLKKGGDSQSPKSSPTAPIRAEINDGNEHRLMAKIQSVDFAFCCVRPPGHHATRSNVLFFTQEFPYYIYTCIFPL
jgi:acetoin utilization deacetylase AcuC-like enzyme